jgi:excisionase family DNA binding protein
LRVVQTTLIDGEPTMTDQKLAFTVDEAALRTGIGRDGIYDAVRAGALEAKKKGRRTIITAEALRRYLESLPALQLPPAA